MKISVFEIGMRGGARLIEFRVVVDIMIITNMLLQLFDKKIQVEDARGTLEDTGLTKHCQEEIKYCKT